MSSALILYLLKAPASLPFSAQEEDLNSVLPHVLPSISLETLGRWQTSCSHTVMSSYFTSQSRLRSLPVFSLSCVCFCLLYIWSLRVCSDNDLLKINVFSFAFLMVLQRQLCKNDPCSWRSQNDVLCMSGQ